jgi:DNA-binding transcriptional MocR family regulator
MAAKFRIKGLFVMPNAANPTGITLSERRRDEIAAVAGRRSLTIIEDDISSFAPSPDRRTFLERLPGSTVYIAAYTAMFAPGFRITYAAFPEKFRGRLTKGLSFLNIKAGSLDAEVVSELILSGGAQEIMRSKRQAAKEANAIFDRAFPRESLGREAKKMSLYPFFRTVDLPPSGLSGPEAEDFFLDRGIKVMHSYRFAVEKAVQRDFLRISISSMRSARQLETGLTALAKALKSFPLR